MSQGFPLLSLTVGSGFMYFKVIIYLHPLSIDFFGSGNSYFALIVFESFPSEKSETKGISKDGSITSANSSSNGCEEEKKGRNKNRNRTRNKKKLLV